MESFRNYKENLTKRALSCKSSLILIDIFSHILLENQMAMTVLRKHSVDLTNYVFTCKYFTFLFCCEKINSTFIKQTNFYN